MVFDVLLTVWRIPGVVNFWELTKRIIEVGLWLGRRCEGGPPQWVKEPLFLREVPNRGVAWVETGSYIGTTTKFLAKHYAGPIYTIEPAQDLADFVRDRFRKRRNVVPIYDTSERCLGKLLKEVQPGAHVCFWLDGHFSGGGTHQGENLCPVSDELEAITEHLSRLKVTVLVDDVRLFGTECGYPPLGALTQWAEANDLSWKIELDVFIAKTV